MNMIVAVQLGTLLVTAAFLTVAMRGADLSSFARLRTYSPTRYEKLKWACRLNGPIVAIFSLALLVSVPSVYTERTTGPIAAAWLLFISISFLFLSVRLFLWSVRS